MTELPLFPLNTVLFPGQPLKLHIFEERYKLMINDCVTQNKPFGVVLIADGVEALGPLASPHLIGSTAHITHVQKLPQERMNILAVGRERFRVKALHHEKPYLIGDVEMIPLQDSDIHAVRKGGRHLRRVLEKYLGILQNAGQIQFDASQIPTDPTTLAYLSAVILQAESDEKQELLESETTSLMIQHLLKHYHLEIRLLEAMVSPPEQENDWPFSLN